MKVRKGVKKLWRSVFGACLVVFILVAAGPVRAGSVRLYYSTYLGGSGADRGYGIAVDGSGNAYVTGETRSIDFPTGQTFQGNLANNEDVFVSKLDPGGMALVYSTYLGGGRDDGGRGIAVDGSGNAYVTGFTDSTDFPTKQAFQGIYGGGRYDTFVFKIGMPTVGDELVVDFGPNGLWHYDHSGPTWTTIAGPAEALENFQGNLAADFGAAGLWLYDGAWTGLGGDTTVMTDVDINP
ncbi:MAG: hypothetical protein GY849_01945 [Deltaproteobacteria bacterium]|nr:hypothetical protein [Deltaproteobacteria bacterium]